MISCEALGTCCTEGPAPELSSSLLSSSYLSLVRIIIHLFKNYLLNTSVCTKVNARLYSQAHT